MALVEFREVAGPLADGRPGEPEEPPGPRCTWRLTQQNGPAITCVRTGGHRGQHEGPVDDGMVLW